MKRATSSWPLGVGLAALAAALVALSCSGEDPVLVGIELSEPQEEEKAPESVWKRNIPESARAASGEEQLLAYEKDPGVFVDVHWFGGRAYIDCGTELLEQMGTLRDRRELGSGRGEELTYEHGVVRVVRDTVYMLRVDLPHPVTRSEALMLTGFRAFVDHWRQTHLEFRTSHEQGFKRLRLKRLDTTSDQVVSVEAWRTSPDEAGR